MPKIIFNVGPGLKELWVEAAHAERVTLSEWIRRACAMKLQSDAPKVRAEVEEAELPLVVHASEEVVESIKMAPIEEGPPAEDDPFIKALTEHVVETISEPGESSAIVPVAGPPAAATEPEPLKPSTNPSILEGPPAQREFKPDFKGEPTKKKRR